MIHYYTIFGHLWITHICDHIFHVMTHTCPQTTLYTGCGGVVSLDRPLLLKFPFGFDPIEVSCGYDDTTILTAQGRAFGCGCSSVGPVYGDSIHGSYTLKTLYGGASNIIGISSGYFCEAYLVSC